MKNRVAVVLVLAALSIGAVPKKPAGRLISIVPRPVKLVLAAGAFNLSPAVRVEVAGAVPEALSVGEMLAQKLRQATGLPVRLNPGAKRRAEKTIGLKLSSELNRLLPEGYLLSVSRNAVTIEAPAPAGLFYGVQTLYQLLPPGIEGTGAARGGTWSLPCLKVEDRPRFGWRGAHLDVCLHFYPVEFVKRYIDTLAMYKLNVFHWHLTEDQGWRLEIKKYAELTRVGAWRRETTYDGKPYGGFYTQEEIRDVVAYAAKRFITVLPEIELPGHCQSALAAYPELSCSGGPFLVQTNWGIYPDVFCAGKEKTFEFLENVLDEVFALFPSPYIHIGGDEVPKTRWRNCVDCQARIKTEGLKDEAQLQSYFVKRIEQFVNARGRRIIGWDEILEGGLAPNAAVMSWRGIEGGLAAARQGHDVVMSPTTHCYFDYYQAREGEPEAFPSYLPIETVYDYDPVPAELSLKESRHILGVQANVWTEYMPDEAQVEYMLLPRLLALSEVAWTPQALRNYRDFSTRLVPQYDRLAARGLRFRLPPPAGLGGQKTVTEPVTLEITPPYPGADVRYTLDGTVPTPASPRLTGPVVKVTQSTLVQARTFLRGGRGSRTAGTSVSIIDPERNGLEFARYEGSWFSLPDFSGLTPVREGRAPVVSLEAAGASKEDYGLELRGYIQVPVPGEYTFSVQADDGARLAIAGREIARNDGVFKIREVSGTTRLGRERWPIVVSYFQKKGNGKLEVYVQGPGIVRQLLPAHWLFLNP